MVYPKKEKTRDFGGILFQHLEGILEISRSELKDTTRIISQGNQVVKEEREDTRISYIQAIENLAYILKPYFDKNIKEVYKKCIKIITAFKFEMIDILKEEHKNIYDKISKGIKDEEEIKEKLEEFIIPIKLRHTKELFSELNMLLKRQNYLAKAVYGETGEETVYADDDEDNE